MAYNLLTKLVMEIMEKFLLIDMKCFILTYNLTNLVMLKIWPNMTLTRPQSSHLIKNT